MTTLSVSSVSSPKVYQPLFGVVVFVIIIPPPYVESSPNATLINSVKSIFEALISHGIRAS